MPVAGIDLGVDTGGATHSVGLGSVVAVSSVAGLLGWALLTVLESRTRRAATIWTAVAVVVAVLSLLGPLTSAVTAGAAAVLVALHVAVAVVLVPMMRRSAAGGAA